MVYPGENPQGKANSFNRLFVLTLGFLLLSVVHAYPEEIVNNETIITSMVVAEDGSTLINHGSILTMGISTGILPEGASDEKYSADGMAAYGNDNRLTNSGTIETLNDDADGMRAEGEDNVLTNSGSIVTRGDYLTLGSDGMGVAGDLNTLTNSGTIETYGAGTDALYAEGNDNLLTNTGNLTTSGDYSSGLHVDGNVNTLINDGSIATLGVDAAGLASHGNSNILSNSGSITTVGMNFYGIYAAGDSNTLRNSGIITTSQENSRGMYAYGNANTLANGNSVTTSGRLGYGMYVDGHSNALINRSTVTTTGELGHGLVAREGGNQLFHSGTIEVSGQDALGILVRESNNRIDISGDITSARAAAVRIGGYFNNDTDQLEQTNQIGNQLFLHHNPLIQGDMVNDGADNGTQVFFGAAYNPAEDSPTGVADSTIVFNRNFSGRLWQGEVVSGSVRLNGERNEFSLLTIDSGATLGGNTTLVGNLVNNGRVAPGNSIGTIIVEGDYQQSAGAVLQMEIGGSQSDLLRVEGNATFDDGALLTLEPIAPILAGQFTLFSVGGSLSGAPLMTLADSALLDFTLNNGSDALTLQVDRTAYAEVAVAENQQAVGAVLDRLLANASGDLAAVLVDIDGLSQIAEVQKSLNALVPSNYAALPDAAFASMRSFTAALPSTESLLASTTTEGAYASHAQTLLLDAQRKGDDGIAGYSINGGGVVVGTDRHFGNLLLGGALSYQQIEIDHDDSRSQSQSETVLAALRAAVQLDHWQLQGLLGYGHEWDDSQREIRTAGRSRQAESDGQADILFAGMKSGYRFGSAALALTPVVGLDYAAYRWGGFGESGAEGLNEEIENTTAESLRSSLGVVLAAPVNFGTALTLDTQLRLAWDHELLDDSYDYTARLSGERFSVRGQELGRDLLSAGLVLQAHLGEKVIAKLGLDYELRHQDEGFAAQVGIIYPF